MFIKRTTKKVNGKTYVNHLLVESVATEKGPRHKILCSLGSLAPAPRKEWLALAHRIESALSGQGGLIPDARVDEIAGKVKSQQRAATVSAREREEETGLMTIRTDRVRSEDSRPAGAEHAGHQMWEKLGMNEVLAEAGLDEKACWLTEVMTLNRLISPQSELAMEQWIQNSSLEDILGGKLDQIDYNHLYRNLDRLHPRRVEIEAGITQREQSLFGLDDNVYLYDLTSTYFEGEAKSNPKAQRGYSRDQRPDCKQVVIGLVVDRHGFVKAHEVFEGNRQDGQTVKEILDSLEKRVGKKPGMTIVVDRGMATAEALKEIQERHYHYIVASRQSGRDEHFDEFISEQDWTEVVRTPSPRNPFQKKSQVFVKSSRAGEELHILCKSDGRKAKDQAIRQRRMKLLERDLSKLASRISHGRLVNTQKIHEAIGRLKERYGLAAKLYSIEYDEAQGVLRQAVVEELLEKAERLDGTYILRTDRKQMTDQEVWMTYVLLTRVENAFRNMKSPLLERPIFHQIARRVEAHIFLCLLAYHLLCSIEHLHLQKGIHTSWETLKETLMSHQITTVVLEAESGEVLRIRKGEIPSPEVREIYETLSIPETLMKPKKWWSF